MSRVLAQASDRLCVFPTTASLEDVAHKTDPFRLVVLHHDTLDSKSRTALASGEVPGHSGEAIVVLSRAAARRHAVDLAPIRSLSHVLALGEPDVSELLVTVQKHLRSDIFGLEKYFPWGVRQTSFRIADSRDKPRVLDAIADYTVALQIPSRLRALVRTVADELITNALYDAPVDREGRRRFADCARTESIRLDPGEEAEVRICCDGQRLGISTIDPFGSLTPDQLKTHLARGFKKGPDQVADRPGGAGLGLAGMFDALSHLVAGICPGRKTEVIGLFDVSGGYRTFLEAGKSFSVFVSTERPAGSA